MNRPRTKVSPERLPWLLALLLAAAAWPQAPQPASALAPAPPRKPAQMLPAERSAILLSAGRDQLERPEEILDRMQLRDGHLVADLGAGVGYYTLRLARRVGPSGAVFAVDVQQGMLDQLLNRAKENGARNILPVLSTAEDARLPAGKIDRILMVDVYHELEQPRAMLESIKRALAPGGKVILVEYRAEQDPATLPVRIPRDHKMSVVEVLREWLPAGFELAEYHEFLPAQHLFVFQKAAVQ